MQKSMALDGWMDGWVGGRMSGWMGGRAGLRIAYSNQDLLDFNQKLSTLFNLNPN